VCAMILTGPIIVRRDQVGRAFVVVISMCTQDGAVISGVSLSAYYLHLALIRGIFYDSSVRGLDCGHASHKMYLWPEWKGYLYL
jgi:hypothetical protein